MIFFSSFISYDLEDGFHSFKDLSEVLCKVLQPENEVINNSIDIEFNDISMKTRLVLRLETIAIKFDEK